MGNTTDLWGAFLRTGSVLVFVIALLILFLYLLKRFSLLKFANPDQELIKILAVHHLSPREKLVLVDVVDEKILLGVTASNIRTLSVIDRDINSKKNVSSTPSPKSFSRFFKDFKEKIPKEDSNGDSNGD